MRYLLLLLVIFAGCKKCYDCKRVWEIENYRITNGVVHVTSTMFNTEDLETCELWQVNQWEDGVPTKTTNHGGGVFTDSTAVCTCDSN